MNFLTKLNKKHIASGKLGLQIIGALFEWRPKALLAFLLLLTPISVGVSIILSPDNYIPCLCLLGLNLVVWLTIKACNRLSGIFSLEKKEAGITWCQISILAALGLWIIGFILIFGIQKDGKLAAAFGVIGSVTGWIFQDKIKGVVAFIHLRMHNLLNIDDWIQVPKYNVDGVVKSVTLTTVTVFNWDTTTSVFPICALQSDHFINLQNMTKGKTYGRQMLRSFTIDTGTIRPLALEEIPSGHDIRSYLPAEEIKDGALNAHLYRMYLYHWLMDHQDISHKPFLLVRWMEQKQSGMDLQVFTFITDGALSSFEWKQSQIIEHIVESMEWFGLRLYQAPSASDLHDVRLAPATKEEVQK
ncbi:MAG: mechanosensitive ion channel [Bacteroidales bacterium]|nr:mechanosensitive ion channel [Bacteroidales bacterium]MBO4565897.1 mechanosensitive ion channel [Bacteroidales bacterium]